MNHLTEEELIAFREGEGNSDGREQVTAHLHDCPECREALARIESVFAALSAMPVPDPGKEYERRVWQQLAGRLPEKSARWWQGFFVPGPLVAAGAFAAVVIVAFLLGRNIGRREPNVALDAGKVRERVLVVAVGEHLGRSEMVLMELENAQPAPHGQKSVDMAATQRRAEDLLEENRLYRQTALRQGDQGMASTLDELERVLLDIANSPDTVTPAQFESLRKRIEDRGILFKVRVVNQDLQQRTRTAKPAAPPTQNESAAPDRSKT